ncbi:MAG: virulence RhuM family protein [Bacilli bacterium]|nr:virulence RhuM family protein [Bacilli bacterium]
MQFQKILLAEIARNRVDSTKDNIDLTNLKGNMFMKSGTEIAKNYLSLEELEIMNIEVKA